MKAQEAMSALEFRPNFNVGEGLYLMPANFVIVRRVVKGYNDKLISSSSHDSLGQIAKTQVAVSVSDFGIAKVAKKETPIVRKVNTRAKSGDIKLGYDVLLVIGAIAILAFYISV